MGGSASVYEGFSASLEHFRQVWTCSLKIFPLVCWCNCPGILKQERRSCWCLLLSLQWVGQALAFQLLAIVYQSKQHWKRTLTAGLVPAATWRPVVLAVTRKPLMATWFPCVFERNDCWHLWEGILGPNINHGEVSVWQHTAAFTTTVSNPWSHLCWVLLHAGPAEGAAASLRYQVCVGAVWGGSASMGKQNRSVCR